MNPLFHQLSLARAAALARAGDYLGATTILHPGSELLRDPRAIDLMARIYAQQGDFPKAQSLWSHVIKMEPGNRAAGLGLERIRQVQLRRCWGALPIALVAVVFGMLTMRTAEQFTATATHADNPADTLSGLSANLGHAIGKLPADHESEREELKKALGILDETRRTLEQRAELPKPVPIPTPTPKSSLQAK
jgi:tetratricopeptide (TPR) repeat protein